MIEVAPDVRDSLLRIAASFTEGSSDPAAVKANAEPLLAWLRKAPDVDDGYVRHDALARHHHNRVVDPERQPTTSAEFVQSAQALYEFLNGN